MKKVKSYLIVALILGCLIFTLVGCGQGSKNISNEQNGGTSSGESVNNEGDMAEETKEVKKEAIPINTTPIANIVVKDYGTIKIELYPELAPNTVNNFITLANEGFYDGLTFHRVIKDFMIQGGDPDGIGTGGPGYSIVGEFADNGYTQNTLSHKKGVLSMARSMDPDSAGSQFFITSADSTYLDKQYAAFGEVIEGMDVVDAIQNVETDANDKPIKDVIIESIRVDTNGVEVPEVIKIKSKI